MSSHEAQWQKKREKRKEPATSGQPYAYPPLGHATNIRLLKIRAARTPGSPVELILNTFEQGKAPAYTALSYSWGSDKLSHTISINNSVFKVTYCLNTFLKELRRRLAAGECACRWWWIDAVCIDQDNTREEKNLVIPLMSRIYEGASAIVCWLGYLPKHHHAAHVAIENYLTGGSIDKLMEDAKVTNAMNRFISSRWWTRTWILPEVSTPILGGPKVWYGKHTRPFDELKDLTFMSLAQITTNYDRSSRTKVTRRAIRAFDSLQLKVSNVIRCTALRGSNGSCTLYELVQAGFNSSCLRPHDKIYAFLSLANDKSGIEVDYSRSTFKVYLDFFWNTIRARRDLQILSYARLAGGPVEKGFPSWLPSWDKTPNSILPFDMYRAGVGGLAPRISFKAGGRILVAAGVAVTSIVQASSPGLATAKEQALYYFEFARRGSTVGSDLDRRYDQLARVLCVNIYGVEELPRDGLHHYDGKAISEAGSGLQFLCDVIDEYKGYTPCFYHLTRGDKILQGTDGSFGIGRSWVRAGDVAVALFGGPVPYVLRPTGDGRTYEFIGHIYLTGIMQREALAGVDTTAGGQLFEIV